VFALRASGFKAHQQWRRGENSKIADRSAVNNQSTGGTYPSPLFVGDGAEREGNSKSREGVSFSRSYRGGWPPRMLPHERGTPLSESPFESHPLWHCIAFVNLVSTQHLLLSTVFVAERVGFEPTVQFPRQQFSRLPDSATLAPLRMSGRTRIFT
jgi:hypothetical protein